jgi:hypothetical protein
MFAKSEDELQLATIQLLIKWQLKMYKYYIINEENGLSW